MDKRAKAAWFHTSSAIVQFAHPDVLLPTSSQMHWMVWTHTIRHEFHRMKKINLNCQKMKVVQMVTVYCQLFCISGEGFKRQTRNQFVNSKKLLSFTTALFITMGHRGDWTKGEWNFLHTCNNHCIVEERKGRKLQFFKISAL